MLQQWEHICKAFILNLDMSVLMSLNIMILIQKSYSVDDIKLNILHLIIICLLFHYFSGLGPRPNKIENRFMNC